MGRRQARADTGSRDQLGMMCPGLSPGGHPGTLAGGLRARSQPRAIASAPEPSPGAPQSLAVGPGSFPGVKQPRSKRNSGKVKGIWGRGGRRHGADAPGEGGRVQGRKLCSGEQQACWDCSKGASR